MRFRIFMAVLCGVISPAGIVLRGETQREVRFSPAETIGRRLFFETRFSQCFADAPVRSAAESRTNPDAMSCSRCHVPRNGEGRDASTRDFCDSERRSSVPVRSDGRVTTPRNSPSLVGAVPPGELPTVLHFDGEFASAEALVAETFLGRNYGWLPRERAKALRQFARVIRLDAGAPPGGEGRNPAPDCVPYAALLAGGASLPDSLRLPAELRLAVAQASDEDVLLACSRYVAAFVRTLQFPRDAEGNYIGTPYDAFVARNGLPRAPRPGETAREYTQRLSEALGGLRAARLVNDAPPDSPGGHFGAVELQGMRIFFKAAIGEGQTSGAGNCAECHTPPAFTDFRFHNTGTAQDEYDQVHGPGAFARLPVPDLSVRSRDYEPWLPATAPHPDAAGRFRSLVSSHDPERADLGAWNVYANPDLPAVQPQFERMLNPGGRWSPAEVLARCLGAFKTATVRNLGHSAPYFHTGSAPTLEDAVRFYQRLSAEAHHDRMRNAPAEYFAMRLGPEDVAPLVAFLRSLNQDDTKAGAREAGSQDRTPGAGSRE